MQSRISSNTNLISFSRDRSKKTMDYTIEKMASLGYLDFDLNFCEMMNPNSVLNDIHSSHSYIEKLNRIKEEYSLNYYSCHLPYQRGDEDITEKLKLSLRYAEELKIGIAVIHPLSSTLDDNLRYLERVLSFTPASIKLAVENMEDKTEFSYSSGLKKLVTHFDGRVGIALDTGHLNIAGEDIESFCNVLKGHIIQTHINDNFAKEDLHLLPGMGNIDWERYIKALDDSGYDGFLNFEAMYLKRNLPDIFDEDVIKLSLKIGSWLLSLRSSST